MPSSIEPPTRRRLLNPKLRRIMSIRPEVVGIKIRPKGTVANATFATSLVTRALTVLVILIAPTISLRADQKAVSPLKRGSTIRQTIRIILSTKNGDR